MKTLTCIALLTLAAVLIGCSGGPETGPGDVHWDRDTCARCVMAVSAPHYAAQVRGGPTGEKTKLYLFDDLGCAVFWLDKQDWKSDPRTEMWVTDWQDGTWIDAFTSSYVDGKTTPMDFGLGAQTDTSEGALNYDQAVAHIYARKQMAH
ncbi:protein NosL [bacterium]|nr:protein NosL [bacterium]